MEEDYKLINNKESAQYEFHIDNYIPKIEYVIKSSSDEVIYLTHTEVPYEMKGRGIGSLLVEKTLADIDENGMYVVPLCSFVASYISKNPQWKKIVMEGITIGR